MTNSNSRPVNLDDIAALLKQNQETLEQILIWTRIGNYDKLKNILETTLNSPQKRLVYHLSDGRPRNDIVKASNVSAGAVSGYWNSWSKLGLMSTQAVTGGERRIKVFNLEDFGIEVPKVPMKSEDTAAQIPTVAPEERTS